MNAVTRILLKVTLACYSVMFTFFMLEVGFRIYGYANGIDLRLYVVELTNPDRLPEGLFIPDPVIQGRLNPGKQFLATTSDFSVIYKINNNGLRDKAYEYEKASGKTRILAFGDSFTFGEGVPYGKRFADIPEQSLPDVEILNFGIPGIGYDKILLYALSESKKFKPDYIFVFLNQCILNRITYTADQLLSTEIPNIITQSQRDATQSTIYLTRDKAVQYTPPDELTFSYALSYLWYRLSLLRLRQSFAAHDRQIWMPDVAGESTATDHIGVNSSIQRNQLITLRLIQQCKAVGCKLVLVNIDTQRIILNFPGIYDFWYYDLSDSLQNLSSRHRLSFTYDPHYNPVTHAYIGKRLADIIEQLRASE